MNRAHPVPSDRVAASQWWERRWFLALLVLAAAIPLLYPPVPPLVDVLGHMGRYRVQLDLASSPALQQFYEFKWAAIGNLGADALVQLLGPLVGLEASVKLIVLAIPPMTVAGFLWVAREVHHRVPPAAFFALPLAYSFPFLFGFVNFTLAVALAMLAFGYWLHLGIRGQTRLRAMLFVPIAILIFFCHAFGWGMLGLMCFSAEAVRQHDRGKGWFNAGASAFRHVAVMLPPILFMVMWRSEASRQLTYGWFEWRKKFEWLYASLSDRWEWFDIASVAVLALLLVYAAIDRRLQFSRNLAFSALVLLGAFVLLPNTIFGSAFADMRLAPYIIAIAVLAIRAKLPADRRFEQKLAIAGLALYAVRLAATTISLGTAADAQAARLEALDQVPRGARMVTVVRQGCARDWALPRNTHLGAMAIVRREAFSNDQWSIEGANLLNVRFNAAGLYRADPSQIARPDTCNPPRLWSTTTALRAIPRHVIDYVWLVDFPPLDPATIDGYQLVWSGEGSRLYKTDRAAERTP